MDGGTRGFSFFSGLEGWKKGDLIYWVALVCDGNLNPSIKVGYGISRIMNQFNNPFGVYNTGTM